jgi:serine/threonine protein kinase
MAGRLPRARSLAQARGGGQGPAPPPVAEHAEARDRFEREAHAVAKLRHENILEIFDYSGRDSPESYIVTEFIEGSTLKQFITEHPPVPEIGAMVVAQIGRALAHAHGPASCIATSNPRT